MKHTKEITYSTGEFARHFGIKKDTLFYYDKIGLFSPAEVGDNGYRYYTASQIHTFRILLSLRELNFPIKVISDYFKDPSPEKLIEITSAQLIQIEQEMEKLTKIQSFIQNLSDSLHEAQEATFDKLLIKELPAMHLTISKRLGNSLETTEEEWAETHDEFILNTNISNNTSVGSIIAKSDILSGNFDRIHCLFAENITETGHLRTGGTFAVYYHKGVYEKVKNSYQKMLEQIDKMGYIVTGDGYEEYLVAEPASDNEEDYVTRIMMPIKKINPQISGSLLEYHLHYMGVL